MRAVIPRRAVLSPVPALPLEAGFQGGAAPLGVPRVEAAKKRFSMGMSLGNGQLMSGRQSAIYALLLVPFRERRPCVRTMRSTIHVGSEIAARETSAN